MTPQQIEEALGERFASLTGDSDRWQVEVGSSQLVVIADAQSDRVRVMVGVAFVDRDDPRVFRRLLEANFAATLDARYAVYGGVLWALFVAPLGALTAHLLDSAISQVLELARTTGIDYTANPKPLGRGSSQMH